MFERTISTATASALIRASKGTFFSVVFTKRDGSDRKLVGRMGVSKYVTGEGLKYAPSDHGLITVYDIQNAGYRMVTESKIKALNINGMKLTVQ
jgi:hypothetical protein